MTLTFTETDALTPGVYDAQVLKIEEGSNDNGDYRRWFFELTLPDGTTVERRAFSTMAGGPKSKAYKWTTVLLGHKPPTGVLVDVIGSRCRVVVSHNEEGFDRITDLLPSAAGSSTMNLKLNAPTLGSDEDDLADAVGF